MMLKVTIFLLGVAFAFWFANEVYKYILARKHRGTNIGGKQSDYPKQFVIEGEILPDFPSYKPELQSIWRILDKNKKLMRLMPEGSKPSNMIGELYTVTYDLDLRKDSEDYPAMSPIKLTITMKEVS